MANNAFGLCDYSVTIGITERSLAQAWMSNSADQSQAELVEIDDNHFADAEVQIRVQFSSLNYKDALALTHTAPIARSYPMVHGIDAVGTVVASKDPRWEVGQVVQVNDWGLGETHWGGLSQLVGVPSAWITPLPEGRSAKWAASMGTAGYTAALCIMALIDHGIEPASGPILVTGVSGGVGSIATLILHKMGYEVVGSTGSIDAAGEPASEDSGRHFSGLGLTSSQLVHRDSLGRPGKPLQKAWYAGVVDSVGSHTLANALAQTQYGGAVAACGLAQGMDFDGTVAPFIFRAVTLYGINCVYRSAEERGRAWQMLADAFAERELDWMYEVIHLEEALAHARSLLDNQVSGRIVVNCA